MKCKYCGEVIEGEYATFNFNAVHCECYEKERRAMKDQKLTVKICKDCGRFKGTRAWIEVDQIMVARLIACADEVQSVLCKDCVDRRERVEQLVNTTKVCSVYLEPDRLDP